MVELLMNWLADAIAVLLETAIGWLSPITGFKFDMFNKTFPFALTAYEIFQSVALVLVLIIAGAHLLPWLFPSDQQSKTSPIRLAFCVVLSVAFIFYGNYILEGIMAIANYPFQALNNTTASGVDWNIGNNIDFGAVTTVLADTFATASILLYVIAMLLIGIAFVKLMIEAIERYCIMMMLIYASPLAASTLASPTTSGIYKKYFLMFISQCILVVLNMWILKMVVSMFTSLNVLSGPERIIGLLMAYAVLRIGGRMDSYLNQLGLNAAITGAGLAGELLGAGMALAAVNSARKGSGNPLGSNAGGKGSMGGILGAAAKAGNFIGQYSPIGAVTRGAANLTGAGLKTVGQGMVAGAKQMMQATSPGTTGLQGVVDRAKQMVRHPLATGSTGVRAFARGALHSMEDNLEANFRTSDMRTASQTAWARGIMKDTAEQISDKMTGNDAGMITPAERADVVNYPMVAEGIYESVTNGDSSVKSPVNVANVMQGLGADEAGEEISEFISVGYGESNADNVSFGMDGEGIYASYDKDNYHHEMRMINEEQYQALSTETQHSYEAFQSGTGKVYYQRHSRDRITPPPRSKSNSGKSSGETSDSNNQSGNNNNGGNKNHNKGNGKNSGGGKKNNNNGNNKKNNGNGQNKKK